MIELPFTLTIDYLILSADSDFITEKEKHFNEEVFCKLLSELQEIKPAPTLIFEFVTEQFSTVPPLFFLASIPSPALYP